MSERGTEVQRRPIWRPGVNGPGWLWVILAAVPVVIVVGIVLAMLQSGGADDPIAEGPNAAANIPRILDMPEEFYGEEVTVTGTVTEVVSDRAFMLQDKDQLAQGTLLVIVTGEDRSALNQAAANSDQNLIRATGILRELKLSQTAAEAGVELDEETLRRYEGMPVVLAEELLRIGS